MPLCDSPRNRGNPLVDGVEQPLPGAITQTWGEASCPRAGNHGTVEGSKPLFLHLKMGLIIVFSHSPLVMHPRM